MVQFMEAAKRAIATTVCDLTGPRIEPPTRDGRVTGPETVALPLQRRSRYRLTNKIFP